jgi:O-antigen biosynthesis protein
VPTEPEVMQEPSLIPYSPLPPSTLAPMLVLAPHPDDEVIACGGLVALAAQAGVPVHVVLVTDGGAGGSAPVRLEESRAALQVLGEGGLAPTLTCWHLPDRGVRPDAALRERMAQTWTALGVRWVLAPSPFEVHPDHRAVCRAAVEALAQAPADAQRPQLVLCEIGAPMLPNALVDITPVLERKQRAMACFASQLAQQAYDVQVLGLNRFRAYTLGPQVTAAEALWFVDEADVLHGVEGLIGRAGRRLRERMATPRAD